MNIHHLSRVLVLASLVGTAFVSSGFRSYTPPPGLKKSLPPVTAPEGPITAPEGQLIVFPDNLHIDPIAQNGAMEEAIRAAADKINAKLEEALQYFQNIEKRNPSVAAVLREDPDLQNQTARMIERIPMYQEETYQIGASLAPYLATKTQVLATLQAKAVEIDRALINLMRRHDDALEQRGMAFPMINKYGQNVPDFLL
jgi:hypothetical protein